MSVSPAERSGTEHTVAWPVAGARDAGAPTALWPVHPWVAEAASRARFAVVGAFLPGWNELRAFVLRCEALGYDAYWMNDHPTRSMDCWTTLASLSMITSEIRLASLVSCIYYRSPFLIARQAADVDRLSGGRAVLGLGVGDDVPEFAQMDLAFPSTRQRQEALAEAVAIISGLWSGERFSYAGNHFSVTDARLGLGPIQEPHVPIIIGGGGEKVTLRQVARFADVANFGPHEWVGSAFTLEDVTRKYALLRRYCAEFGRPFASILRSHWTPLVTLAPDEAALEAKRRSTRIPDAALKSSPLFATPEGAVAHFQSLADCGVQYFLATVNGTDEETLHLLAERVMPKIRPGPSL